MAGKHQEKRAARVLPRRRWSFPNWCRKDRGYVIKKQELILKESLISELYKR